MTDKTGRTPGQYAILELTRWGNGLAMGVVLVVVVAGLGGCRAVDDLVRDREGQTRETSEPFYTPTAAPTAPATPTAAPSVPLTPTPEYPDNLVASNDDWTPVIREFDGVEMALVPAGCFMMGSTDEEIKRAYELFASQYGDITGIIGEDESPQHEVCIAEPFWIDVYEVTNEQYGQASQDCWEYSSEDDQPAVCMTWFEAVAHCESRGGRLPTEAEWEYAVRGPDGLAYPWGNQFDGTLVNFCDANCANIVRWADTSVNDGYVYAAPVGSFPGGISWVGAYDLSGNVWELVNDFYGPYLPGRQINPTGPASGFGHLLRGGSWSNTWKGVHAADRNRMSAGNKGRNTGFRCVRPY